MTEVPSDPLVGAFLVRLAFLPMIVAAFVVQERFLPKRSVVAVRAVQAAVLAAVALVNADGFSSIVAFALICVPLTLLGFRDSWSKRLFVCALLLVSATTAEVMGECVWKVLTEGAPTGSTPASIAFYPQHVVSCLLGAGLLLLAPFAIAPQIARLDAQGGTLYSGFTALLLAQAAALYCMGKGVMFGSAGQLALYLAAAGMGLAGLVGDVGLVVASCRLREQAQARRRAEELSGQLEGLLDHYRAEASAVERAARLRHDARNHLQAILILDQQGRSEEAARYAAAIADGWADDAGGADGVVREAAACARSAAGAEGGAR